MDVHYDHPLAVAAPGAGNKQAGALTVALFVGARGS